jgi:CHAD domain-containing protein
MEIEAKFAVPDNETCRRLREVEQIAGFLLSAGHSKEIHDTYLDTPGQAIRQAGYACRKREQENKILITLKQLGTAAEGIHRRKELEITLTDDLPPAQWPASPARDLVLQLIQQEPLVALFDLCQTRFVRLMRSHSERLVAELSIDEVRIGKHGSERTYVELEVELLQEGTESDLEEIRRQLREQWALQPESCSKFERALTLLSAGAKKTSRAKVHASPSATAGSTARKLAAVHATAHPMAMPSHEHTEPLKKASGPHSESPARKTAHQSIHTVPKNPGLKIDDTMAEGARKTLYFHFKRMVQHEPGTRAGDDIEELHDMRVATRRMRAALRVFGEYLDMSAMKPFAKDLQRAGRALGAVRDLDVLQQKTLCYVAALPPQRANELEPLFAVIQAEHQKARQALLDFLDSPRYERFKKRFSKFLKKPGAAAVPVFTEQGETRPQRIRHVVPVVIQRRLAAVRAYEGYLEGPDVPLERLHRLRIAFKSLRYTLEFFREVLGPDTRHLIEELKQVQDHLGDLQDAVVTCTIVRDFLNWGTWGNKGSTKNIASFKPVIAPGVVSYLSVRQAELQRLVAEFPAVWDRMQQSGFFKKIAGLTEEL